MLLSPWHSQDKSLSNTKFSISYRCGRNNYIFILRDKRVLKLAYDLLLLNCISLETVFTIPALFSVHNEQLIGIVDLQHILQNSGIKPTWTNELASIEIIFKYSQHCYVTLTNHAEMFHSWKSQLSPPTNISISCTTSLGSNESPCMQTILGYIKLTFQLSSLLKIL